MPSEDQSTNSRLTRELNIIVAISKNRAIGNDGEIPWHYPEDMEHFKRTTKGHPIIMGRKTYDSIGRPLPKRLNIIVTRSPDLKIEGCVVTHSLEEALKFANNSSLEVPFIIGGAEVYKMALPLTTRLYLTVVNKECEGDTFFPELESDKWELQSSHTIVRPDKVKLYHYTRKSYEFERFGSGDPAAVHEDPPEPRQAQAEPSFGRSSNPESNDEEQGGGRRRRRRRRRRGSSNTSNSGRDNNQDSGQNRARDLENGPPVGLVPSLPLSAGQATGGRGRKKGKRGKGKGQHNQDRAGRAYEAPSRFLFEAEEKPLVHDDDIDEEWILRARGDSSR